MCSTSRQALENCAAMTAVGGRVIHMTPIAGYIDHAFTQLCPKIFQDFYDANGFSEVASVLAVLPLRRTNHRRWELLQWSWSLRRKKLIAEQPLCFFYCAEKRATHERFVIPIQREITYGDTDRSLENYPWGLEPLSF